MFSALIFNWHRLCFKCKFTFNFNSIASNVWPVFSRFPYCMNDSAVIKKSVFYITITVQNGKCYIQCT